jgi:hypothetical protein
LQVEQEAGANGAASPSRSPSRSPPSPAANDIAEDAHQDASVEPEKKWYVLLQGSLLVGVGYLK